MASPTRSCSGGPTTIRFCAQRRGAEHSKAWGWKQIKNPDAYGPRAIWVKARADALDPITMHECRHTYASTMVAAGVDPGEVMRRIGHSTIAMTLDRYTHGIRGNEAATADKLQAFMDQSRGTVEQRSERFGAFLSDTASAPIPNACGPSGSQRR